MRNETCIVTIEGTDGSGKGTQVKLLNDALKKYQKTVKIVDFPVYTDYFGKEIGNKLRDGSISSLDPKSIALWYAIDRLRACNKVFEDYELPDYVIFNRSTVSNMIYQMSRCKNEEESLEIGKWIYAMEKKQFSIPFPNIIFILDIDLGAYEKNIMKKSKREYLDDNHPVDANENDKRLILNTINMYKNFSSEYLQKIDPNLESGKGPTVIHIDCIDSDGNMKSELEISNLIMQYLISVTVKEKIQYLYDWASLGIFSKFINCESKIINDGNSIHLDITTKPLQGNDSEQV